MSGDVTLTEAETQTVEVAMSGRVGCPAVAVLDAVEAILTARTADSDAALERVRAEGFGTALRAVLDRAADGIEFGPDNYSLLVRIVRDVDLAHARAALEGGPR
jgi:hypothetical protein